MMNKIAEVERMLKCTHSNWHAYCPEWAHNLSSADLLWWASCSTNKTRPEIYIELAHRLDCESAAREAIGGEG